MENCRKCNALVGGNYCSNCGTPTKISRIDKSHVIHEFEHYVLHYEKGILFTLKELAINPGNAIRNFIYGDRANYYKPIGFLIITSALYSLLEHYLGYHPSDNNNSTDAHVSSFMRDHLIYFSLIQIFILSYLIKNLFYKKKNYNIYEYFIVLSYSAGMSILISSIGVLVIKLTHLEALQFVFPILGFGYGVWLIGQFMEENNFKGYGKAFASKFLSILIFLLISSVFFTVLTTLHINY